MRAFFDDGFVVIATKHELQLLKAGAQEQAKYACQMRDCAGFPETREIWSNAYADYQKLVSDIEVILNSMPF